MNLTLRGATTPSPNGATNAMTKQQARTLALFPPPRAPRGPSTPSTPHFFGLCSILILAVICLTSLNYMDRSATATQSERAKKQWWMDTSLEAAESLRTSPVSSRGSPPAGVGGANRGGGLRSTMFEMRAVDTPISYFAQELNTLELHPNISGALSSSIAHHQQLRKQRTESVRERWMTEADIPRAAHRSGVFPQSSSASSPPRMTKTIDSVILVSFDVFSCDANGTTSDPLESTLRRIFDEEVPHDGSDAQLELQHRAWDAATWLLGRAFLTRPSKYESHEGHDYLPYFNFFSERRVAFSILHRRSGMPVSVGSRNDAEGEPSTCLAVQEHGEDTPVLMDVVYTYVEDDAPSQKRFREMFPSLFHRSEQRYRNWNEILYSMRSVYFRSMCFDPLAGDGNFSGCNTNTNTNSSGSHDHHHRHHHRHETIPMVHIIFIVVADLDQTPKWLKASHPQVRFVTHHDIFPTAEHAHALPTFNSHAIESVIHRIPGLSRFFVYFNNDMMWGRRVSFFDYFRPLSHLRQRARERILVKDGCRDDAVGMDVLRRQQQPRHHQGSSCSNNHTDRVTFMFEPIQYYENDENQNDMQMVNRVDKAFREDEGWLSNEINHTIESQSSSQSFPIDVLSLFEPTFKLPSKRRMGVASEKFRVFAINNRNFVLEVLGIAGWPSHSFAHFPRLMDRDILRAMSEVDFSIATTATRMLHRSRHTTSFWVTMACHAYHLMHRKVLDSEAVLQEVESRDIVNATERNKWRAYFEWPKLPRSLHEIRKLRVDDVVPPYWKNAKDDALFGLESMRFSHDLLQSIGSLISSASSSESSRWISFLFGGSTGEAIPSSSSLQKELIVAEKQGLGACLCEEGKSSVSDNTITFVQKAISWHLTPGGGANTRERFAYSGFGQDCIKSREKATKKMKSQVFKRQSNGRVAVVPTTLEEIRWLITDMEKLDHHVVKLDQKSGMYHFCMMNSPAAVQRYTREMKADTKLFVTVNDDLGSRSIQNSIRGMVQALLSTATGNLPPAVWEIEGAAT